jgi:hypothetical protein
MTLSCEQARDRLVELVFGMPNPSEETQVHEHLHACEECRNEERRLLDLRDAAGGDAILPGAALRTRIAAAWELEARARVVGAGSGAGPARRNRLLARRVPAYVAVAAALVAALATALLPWRAERTAERPIATPAEPALVRGSLPFATAEAHETWVRPDSSPAVAVVPSAKAREDSL